jgi:hypothetical protein
MESLITVGVGSVRTLLKKIKNDDKYLLRVEAVTDILR